MIRRLGTAIAVLLILAPACGCTTLQRLTGVQARVELAADQSLYAAEAAFQSASIALDQAIDRGALKGGAAAAARAAYGKAHDALLAARKAKASGDAALAAAKTVEVLARSGDVERLAQTGAAPAAAL